MMIRLQPEVQNLPVIPGCCLVKELTQSVVQSSRRRYPRTSVRGRISSHFRKACRCQFQLHLPQVQDFRQNPRTCFEGPFGELLRATGPMAKTNPFRFSNKYQDDENDLIYYGYRYYNADTGRWLSRDPLRTEASPNLYLFCSNRGPYRYDLLGLLDFDVTVHMNVPANDPIWPWPTDGLTISTDRSFHPD
ncbi:MAG: RHS repeat-associated core domain-containing protein [Verrucomicrobiota bacterium]